MTMAMANALPRPFEERFLRDDWFEPPENGGRMRIRLHRAASRSRVRDRPGTRGYARSGAPSNPIIDLAAGSDTFKPLESASDQFQHGTFRSHELPQEQRANLDEATVASFGDEWSRYDQSKVSETELARMFKSYFIIFPWDSVPAKAERIRHGLRFWPVGQACSASSRAPSLHRRQL
jgi:hypothetical protein